MLALLMNLGFAAGGAVTAANRVVAGPIIDITPRFAMGSVVPPFLLTNRQPRFPFDRVEVDE